MSWILCPDSKKPQIKFVFAFACSYFCTKAFFMKKTLILAAGFAMMACGAVAQETSVPKRITIIEGKFFRNLPEEVAKMMTPDGIKFFMLSTPNGTKAVGIKMPEPLTNEMLRDTIPMVQVPEAAELLRRFDEAQARSEGIGVSSGRTEPLLKEGTKFPEFTATDMNGRTWSNADVKGKVMVLNVWFTGCGPCRAEMPELSAWKDEMPGVMFFSSTFESAKVAHPVIESRGFNWIPLVNDTVLYKYVGNNGFPLTVVIDKEGTVVMAEHGTSATKREALKRKIKSLIK